VEVNWRFSIVALSVGLLLCVSCGSKNTTTTVPEPTPTPGVSPLPTPDVTRDNLPDVTHAAPYRLASNSDLSGLQSLFGVVYPPLVGDPLIKMMLTGDTRQTAITGTVRLALEDKQGLVVRDIPSFDATGYRDSSRLDIIFADSQLVVKTVGTFAADGTLTAAIFYRVRQSGETQCQNVQFHCYDQYGHEVDPSFCGYTKPNLVATCQTYMNSANSAVKQLGSFTTKEFPNWQQ
jgi:hypothetical protein